MLPDYNEKKISVIIPTYNREDCLLSFLEDLSIQDYKSFEVIIIDQSEKISIAKQEFVEINKSLIKLYKINERGRSLAKNYGILWADGDIILFCDDDIRVPSNFISTHANCYNNKEIGAVSCRLVEEGQPSISIEKPLQTTFYGKFVNKAYSTTSGFVSSLNGGNMSIRKEALVKAGYFEEYFIGTSMVEEPDLAFRILKQGYKIYFDASITVMHYPQYNGNIAEMISKRKEWFYNYFYNVTIFFAKYGRKTNMPFVLLYCLLLSIKHTLKYKLSLKNYIYMVSGFFKGAKMGNCIYKESLENLYYTPYRKEKTDYTLLYKKADI